MFLLILVCALGGVGAQSSEDESVDPRGRPIVTPLELVAKADRAASRAYRLMGDGHWEGAAAELKEALVILPNAPVVQPRRLEYSRAYHTANLRAAVAGILEGKWQDSGARIGQSWAEWLSLEYLHLRRDPGNWFKAVRNWPSIPIAVIFVVSLVFGVILGRIRIGGRTVGWQMGIAFLPPIAVAAITLIGVVAGMFQHEGSIGDLVAAAGLLGVFVTAVCSVPILAGAIVSRRFRARV